MNRVPRVAVLLSLKWPLKRHAHLFAGVERYAQQQGWHLTIDEIVHDKLPKRRTESLPYDGVICRATKSLAEPALRLGLPLVNTWLSSPVRDLLPGVFPDFVAAGRLRAVHLLARGLRNFAAITNRTDQADKMEAEEFHRIVGEAGCPCPQLKVPRNAVDPRTWRITEQLITQWMDQWEPPIGVYVGRDMVGRVLAQLCIERGWRVPENVAIITGQNEEVICEQTRPTLTSVEMGFFRVGNKAAELLDRLMKEKKDEKNGRKRKQRQKAAAPPRILVPPVGLVVRESTDFYAVDDPLVAGALEFIAANSHDSINIDDVAQALQVHSRQLQRRFREVLDRPVVDEIRRVRIERAKRELTQGKRSISEIAREVGFGERMRMTEIFRRELGVTPSEFRRQRQDEDRH